MLDNIAAANHPNVKTRVLDARCLSRDLDKGTFSHVFSTFVLQSITTPLDSLREMHAVLAPSGTISLALWAQRNGPFEIWEAACKTIEPTYTLPPPFDDPLAWRSQHELRGALETAGFVDVQIEEVKMPFEFASAEAFADFWFQARNPAAVKLMGSWPRERTEGVREAVKRVVKEQYGGGKEIYTWAVLGVGRKTEG